MIIAAWVIGGAPQGNPALLPKLQVPARVVSSSLVEDALTIETRNLLKEGLCVAGVNPLTDTVIDSAQVIAILPDGRIEPLVWLYHFDPKYRHNFLLRRPLNLPQGTLIESSAPLKFALETAARGTDGRKRPTPKTPKPGPSPEC